MATQIIMPQLGESIAEGTIVKWLKQPGDSVKKDENILLISTDKVEAEIPSPIEGVLVSIDVQNGQTVPVGSVLGYVGAKGEAPAKTPTPSAPKAAVVTPAPTPVPTPAPAPVLTSAPMMISIPPVAKTGLGGFLSPLVRKIASENQVTTAEFALIQGTGREGRITKKDILAYLQNRPSAAQIAQNQPTAATPASPAPAFKTPSVLIPPGEKELVQPVSTMRRVIMENMVKSRQTSAHVTTFFDIDYTAIERVRLAHKDRFKAQEGVSLTYTTFLAAAVCQVLKRHPYINAEIRGDKVAFKRDIHLGIAVAIESPEPGLMVPVIRSADQLNLRGLAHSIADLGGRTKARKIKPDELSGGTFTITNPGNYGGIIGTPIINQPQVAILGVGRIHKQPVVISNADGDSIGIRLMGVLALSFDHRLIDGATADIFMADLKYTLETWTTAP